MTIPTEKQFINNKTWNDSGEIIDLKDAERSKDVFVLEKSNIPTTYTERITVNEFLEQLPDILHCESKSLQLRQSNTGQIDQIVDNGEDILPAVSALNVHLVPKVVTGYHNTEIKNLNDFENLFGSKIQPLSIIEILKFLKSEYAQDFIQNKKEDFTFLLPFDRFKRGKRSVDFIHLGKQHGQAFAFLRLDLANESDSVGYNMENGYLVTRSEL